MTRTLPLWLAVVATGCGPADDGACDPDASGTICTIAGVGQDGYDGDDPVPALDALMSLPTDTLVGPEGVLYILDWNNHRLRRLDPDGTLRWVAGRGELGGTLDDPAGDDFNHPTGLIWDCQRGTDIVIAAWHNSKIRTLDLATGALVDTCGDGRRAYFGDEGPALTASLDLPTSLACSPAGDLVVMDQANQVIRRIDASGTIHRMAGVCVIDASVTSGEPGPCDAPVQCPGGSGKWTCGDPASTCDSTCAPGYNGDEVEALAMRMAQPVGQSADPGGRLLYDPDGNLLFADSANHVVRRLAPDGRVTRIAGVPGESGYSGDGGPATAAHLNHPTDLALADDGTLYLSDVYNHCIRAIAPDGTIDTLAGRCGEHGFEGDGAEPRAALLKLPMGIEWADGMLYIADSGNDRIRSIVLQ